IECLLQQSLGESYRLSGKYREAIQAYKLSNRLSTMANLNYVNESNLADVYTRMDSLPQAFAYGFNSLASARKAGDSSNMAWIYGILSRASLKGNRADSAIYYAKLGLTCAQQSNALEFLRDNNLALANAYAAKKDFGDAYHYHLQYISYRDSMLGGQIRNQTALLAFNSQLGKKEVEITALGRQKKDQQKILYSIAAILLLILLSAILLWRNNHHKQKANKVLEKTLSDLKQTQSQLIKSEKMASLGELTAGIAHEIQNPLNFVNNFSEVNKELLVEMKEQLDKGNMPDAKLIAEDVISNEEKINQHGKRADAIVKGMLQHSQSSKGHKAPTDINALCDEYLRLSYHGLRAKDKSFNATIKTDFDNAIGNINIIPQDIGRVLLNLYNNAFYVVNEKNLTVNQEGFKNLLGLDYEPTVSISTKKINDKIEISVSDNGNGIPQTIVDKIFQPFFTTKPTGQGTGLGLSLSYDIIKAHGGEIKVETREGEGSTFVIRLPFTN
ncbi:MAG: ATP-binding protein, partial [Ginsengibacter sp.]